MLNVGTLGPAAMNEHWMQKISWQMANLPVETANAFANWYLAYGSAYPESVEKMRELLAMVPGRIRDMAEMEKKSGPIVVVGSGSSLNEVAPTLKDWKGAVMCSTSQAATLSKLGRNPDYIVCLDPRDAPADELAAEDWGEAILVGHVSIPHTYVVRWLERARTPIYVGRIMEPTYDWYSHHLGRGYPWIRHIIMPMIDSGAAEISLATWLGYSPIYIVGIDYGGPRANMWYFNYEKKEWKYDEIMSGYVAQEGSGIHAMSYASRGSLISAFHQITNPKYQQRIYQLSDRSLLVQFPKVEWGDLLAGRMDHGEYPRQKIREEVEMALAVWDTFMVQVESGWGIDYHTYITSDATAEQIKGLDPKAVELMHSYGAQPQECNYFSNLFGYNHQITRNLEDFARVEAEQKEPIPEMIAKGLITVEAGDLLLHGAEEFKSWDWHKIKPIDIPATLQRRRWLLKEAKERGYVRGTLPVQRERKPGDFLHPEIAQVVEMNKGGTEGEVREAFLEAVDEIRKKETEEIKKRLHQNLSGDGKESKMINNIVDFIRHE